jgi:hypothetical protein
MALSCEIKEQIFTFQGKDYNYTEFRRMMIAGLMDAVEGGKSFLVAGEGDAKNVVDVLDSDALDAFLQDASGNNALGISKGRIINQAIRAMNSLVASGKGYNEQTGKGVRIFISKTHADHQAAQQGAEGKRSNNRGFIVPRVDEAGNEQGYDIYINLEAASAATVGHEVMHFYLTELFGEGSPLLKKFVDSMNNLLKGSDIQYLTAFASRYKEEMRPEEYLVEMGGMLANRMASADPTAKEQTLFEKIADLFNEFLYKISKGKLGYTIDVSSKTAVQEFFESLAGAVADGKAFSQQLAEAAKKEVEQPAADSSQAGGPQGQAAPAPALPQEIESLDDNQIVTLTYQSLDEIPEALRSKAKSVKGGGIEITKRRSILGIPVGKETKIKRPATESYIVVASGAEVKQAAREQFAMTQPTAPAPTAEAASATTEPAAEGPVRPEAREGKIGEYVDSSGNKISEDKIKYSIIHSFSDRVTGFTWEYLSSSKDFEALKKADGSGQITDDRTLDNFVGKYVYGHSPDAAFSGIIKKKDSNGNWVILVEGKGGIFYPIRYIEDLFVWASTAQAAVPMARQLNENAKKNGGSIYLALVSAPEDKLLSSTTSSNGVIDIFKAMSNDVEGFGIPKNVFKNAMLKAAKAKFSSKGKVFGLGLNNLTQANTVEEIESEVRKKLAANASVFDDRKTFSKAFIREFAKGISGTKAEQSVGKFILQGFEVTGYKQQGNIGEPGKEKYKLSPTNMVSAISQMMGEPMLRGESSKKVYAIIEVTPNPKGVDSPSVEPFDSDLHESYPKAIKLAGKGMQVRVHILQDRELWTDRFEDPQTGALVTPDREKKLFPTSGVTTTSLKVLPKKEIPQAKESKISQIVSAPTGTQAMPSSTLGITPEITAKESKIIKVFDDTGFISVQSMVESLINDREYLNSVIASILEAREILKKGKVRREATVAAYLITIGSVGSMGMSYESWSAGGKTMSKVFLEKKEGSDWVRPEGAAAAYLYTDAGKKLIEDFIGGTATKEQITDMFLFIGMGRENIKTRDVFNTMQSGGIKKMTDLLNANKGEDFDKLYEGAQEFLSGIAVGKTGFFNQYFGVSGRAVLDAREWNAWIAGQMRLTKEQMERRGKYEVSPEVQQMLLDRIEEVGLALGYSKDLAGYIAHHAIWDAVADTMTEHAGEYSVIKEYQKPKAKRKAKFSVIPSASVNEESREFITVAQRRIDKLGFDGRDADAQVLRDRGLFKDPEEFEMSRKAAGDLFAQTLYDPAIASLPPLEIAKAMVDKIDTIENLPSKIYFSGNVHAFIDDMVMSKKIGKKLRGNLKALSDEVVAEMALKGREYGQASAMFARVYSDFKKFDFLVQKKKMEQEMEAKFNSTQLGDGKNLKDAVDEVRSDVEELLSQSSELSELVELAGEVNDTYMSDHADAVAHGDISGLKDPKTVTAEEFIEQKNKFEEVIRDLENKIKGLQDRLADVTKLYTNEQTKNASQAKTISDLRGQISKLNALIDKLRESNKKISAKASYYKQELQKLRDKFANLKSLLAILKANKYISKQRQDKMMQALIDMITSGKLDDPDFDSVFGEVFQISVVSSKDKAALESLANGLKYLAENPNSEISQAYIKRFNDYLESVSTEAWDSYRVASLLHSMFYTSVLSGWSTVFNATFGSIFTAVPNASLYSFVNIILNPKTAIGSIIYGMRRMAMETPAAASKGVFAQRDYDNLGTSWSGENLTDNADLAEVHLVKGFARNLDRLKKGDIKSMPKNLVAVLGSIVYPLTVIKRLMMFIDPTVTHMLSSYVQGSMEYKMAVDELKTIKSSAPKDMLDVLTTWSPFLNLRHLRKIDEHVNYAKKDRKAAADQALEEIDKLKDKGIKIERDYARRRTSQILREKIGKERALMFDKIARDWLMMWRPDGIIGAAWDSSTKGLALKRDNEKNGGAFMNYSKTAISMLFFTFLRITGAGINIAQAATPIFGLPLAIFGVRKNHQEGRGVMGQWGWGYKYKTSKEGVLAPLNPINIYKDLRAAEDFESKRAVSRIGISLFSHMVTFAVLSNMFDMADEDEEDETGYVDIPLLGKFKLSEDRAIDITSSGTGGSPKSQESQEGRVSFAVRFKDGDKWGRWMSYKLAPHVLAPFALIGRAADDAKGIYYNPKGMADTARPADGIMEYGAEIPLAIGEWSFNSLGRLWSSSRYDASGAFTKFMLNPFYAIAQPRAASDIITMSEDMLDLPKKNLYEGEGASDALTNLNYSIYGVGRLFAPDATDQFGLPVKTINPITNWWTYASDESLRSKEIPEWNLAYRYQNTNIPSNMSFRIERVDATTGSGHLLDSDQKKYLSDYEKYVSLSSDEQTLVTNLVKAEFRKRMLDVYETLPKEAAEYSSSDYIDPGEYVSEEINKILKEAKEYVKDDVILMVNASDRKEKQKYMDGIFKYTDKVNRESNEISKKILSSGPLPMTGLGRDVKRRVRVKKITL